MGLGKYYSIFVHVNDKELGARLWQVSDLSTFVNFLQTDDVSVVAGQLLLDQVLPIVQLQGVGGTVRVEHVLRQFRLGVDVGQYVVGRHPHSRPLRPFHSIHVAVVEGACAWSRLYSPHREELLGQATPCSIFGRAKESEPAANVLVGWDVDPHVPDLYPTAVLTRTFLSRFRAGTKSRQGEITSCAKGIFY